MRIFIPGSTVFCRRRAESSAPRPTAGVIVLIDERYAEEPYHSLLPAQFRRAKFVGDVRALAAVVGDFWEAQIGVQINPGENSQK